MEEEGRGGKETDRELHRKQKRERESKRLKNNHKPSEKETKKKGTHTITAVERYCTHAYTCTQTHTRITHSFLLFVAFNHNRWINACACSLFRSPFHLSAQHLRIRPGDRIKLSLSQLAMARTHTYAHANIHTHSCLLQGQGQRYPSFGFSHPPSPLPPPRRSTAAARKRGRKATRQHAQARACMHAHTDTHTFHALSAAAGPALSPFWISDPPSRPLPNATDLPAAATSLLPPRRLHETSSTGVGGPANQEAGPYKAKAHTTRAAPSSQAATITPALFFLSLPSPSFPRERMRKKEEKEEAHEAGISSYTTTGSAPTRREELYV